MSRFGTLLDRAAAFVRRYLPANPGRFVMPYLVVVITAVLALGIIEARSQSTELREGLLRSCVQNGDPLRNAMQLLIQDDVSESQNLLRDPEAAEALLPATDPEILRALLRNDVRDGRRLLASIPDVDCEAQWGG